MRKTSLASLKKREDKFIKNLEKSNKFTYSSGYKGYKYPVRVFHNKCGSEVELIAETVLNNKKADECIYCTTSIRNKSIEEIQNIIDKKYTNLKIIKKCYMKSKPAFLVQCQICKHEYRVTFNQLKNKTFKCCENGKSIYNRHLDRNVMTILSNMKPSYLLGQSLYDYIEESVEELSYIKTKNIDKEKFIFDIYQEINLIYMEKKIAQCLCCGEWKKGSQWKNNYENKICQSCLEKEKECQGCHELKKQKYFNFDLETINFDEICIKCSEN